MEIIKENASSVTSLEAPDETIEESSSCSKPSTSVLSKYVIIVCIATTLGTSIPVGYHLSVINAPAEYVKDWCNVTILTNYNISLSENELQFLWASIVSIYLVGGIIGSTSGAWIADKFGRKFTLLAGSLFFLIGAMMFIFCRSMKSVEMLMIGRLIVGLGSGITTATGPMYLSEVSPLAFRGSAGTFLSLGMVIGILAGEAVSLDEVLGSRTSWHYAFSAFGILVLIGLAPYYWFPESPKYLYIIADKKENARIELKRLRKNNDKVIEEELKCMQEELENEPNKRSIWSVIRDPSLTLPLCLVCALQAGHQLSGVNAVVYYSVSMIELTGIESSAAKWINLGIGFSGLVVACCTPTINAKINRRIVILTSVIASAIFLSLIFLVTLLLDMALWLVYANIATILGFIISFEVGFGPIPFFIASELFESAPRPAAMALGSIISWLCNIIVGMSFPLLQIMWGAFVFLPFAVICFLLAIFLKMYLPETRGVDSSIIGSLVKDGFRSKPLTNL